MGILFSPGGCHIQGRNPRQKLLRLLIKVSVKFIFLLFQETERVVVRHQRRRLCQKEQKAVFLKVFMFGFLACLWIVQERKKI